MVFFCKNFPFKKMINNFYNALLVLYGLDKPSFTAKLKKENRFEESATQKFNAIESVLVNRRTYVSNDFL